MSELLIEAIYEAAALPELWPRVLEILGRIVDTPGVVLLTRRSDSWVGCAVSKPIEESMTRYLQTDIPARSETTSRLIAADHAGFLGSDDLYTREAWEREPFRAEFGRRWGWDHAAATAIQIPSGDLLVVHAQRREGEPAFSAKDKAQLDSFRPHLARAGLLSARLRMQRFRAATEALALVGLPAAIVDTAGRVLSANALLENLKPHVRWLARDRLGLVNAVADLKLKRAVHSLCDPKATDVLSFVSRPGEGEAAIIHVVPVAGQARDLFDSGVGVVIVTPLADKAAPDLALIRGLFDLTPSEARVARELARGRTLLEIADEAGVSRTTVRTQIKAVFAKTGTTRQAEAAALLAGIPDIARRKQ